MYMDNIYIFAKNELETLIQTIRIYSQNIGMEFGIEKCVMLLMKKGRHYQIRIASECLGGKENYKSLGILEADAIKQIVMKEKV